MPETRSSRAFTLVELLVVVAIVTILIALLMPAIGKARKYAQEVHCAANLRSQGQALNAYVNQYGYYPGCVCIEVPNGSAAIWPTRLRAFMGGDRRPFNCPAQDEQTWWTDLGPGGQPSIPASEIHADWFGYEVGEPLIMLAGPYASYFTYAYNVWGVADAYEGSYSYGDLRSRGLGSYISIRPESRSGVMPGGHGRRPRFSEIPGSWVRRPGEMIAIADSTVDGKYDCMMDASTGIMSEPPYGWPGTIHRGGANVLFCDGHVAWYRQKDLVDFSGPLGESRRRMWHSDHEP